MVCVNMIGKLYRTQGVNLIIFLSFTLMTIVRYLIIKKEHRVILRMKPQILLIFEIILSVIVYMLDLTILSIFTIGILVYIFGVKNQMMIKKLYKTLTLKF